MAISDKLKKFAWTMKVGMAGRSGTVDYSQFTNYAPQILQRRRDVNLTELYELAKNSNAIRKSVQTLRDYVFKEGYEWEPQWSKKCAQCDKEFPPGTEPDWCMRCGNQELIEPDDDYVTEYEEFFKYVDRNGRSFVEVLKHFEDNLNVADDAFLVITKDYKIAKGRGTFTGGQGRDGLGRTIKWVKKEGESYEEGDILGWTVKEMWVPDPRNFHLVVDTETMVPGGKFWICLRHRPVSENYLQEQPGYEPGQAYEAPGHCDICGARLYDVWYVSTRAGSADDVQEYYLGDVKLPNGTVSREVIHTKKYGTDYGYGYSPIVSVYDRVMALLSMERYIRTFYEEQRSPRSALFVPTANPDAFEAAVKEAEDINVSQGGHYMPKFTFDPGLAGGPRNIQYIEFAKLPQELQFAEYMDDCYRRIGSAFGVAPVFHGNVDAVGLQNQGPTQWQVTTDAATLGQWIYNHKVFPALMEQMGVEGWTLKLKEVEQQDELQKEQVELAKVNRAMMMQQLGFGPTERDVEGNFVFPSKPDPNAGMMGGMGGMMGGGFGGGGMGQPTSPPMNGGEPEGFRDETAL